MQTMSVICVLCCQLAAADTPATDPVKREHTFVRALELFDAAETADDYRTAALAFESLLADGFQNGAVYYNAGNAWYRAGEFGRAILNYRRALPYRPRDPYLQANLQQALAVAPGRLETPPAPFRIHLFFWNQWIPYPTKVRVAGIGLFAAAVLAVISVILQLSRLRLLIGGLLVIFAAVAIDAGLSYQEIHHRGIAVITAETVARKGTGRDYEPAFDQPLRDGAEFRILAETSDWVLGHFPGIGDGWVRQEFVAR